MSDKIREMLSALRVEADHAITRAELAEEKNKKYEQLILKQDQRITDLEHKGSVLDIEFEKSEAVIAELKQTQEQREASSHNAGLIRKIELLEEELEVAERNMREAVERLQKVEYKAEDFQRQVQKAEEERDEWERKYEDIKRRYE
ncbi:hypothetical protein AB1N83_009651 [Pleurotus pulmonarius]